MLQKSQEEYLHQVTLGQMLAERDEIKPLISVSESTLVQDALKIMDRTHVNTLVIYREKTETSKKKYISIINMLDIVG